MKRNLVVLFGAIAILISDFAQPIITFTQYEGGAGQTTPWDMSYRDGLSIIIIPIVLMIMLIRWRWRGGIWIALGIAAIILIPTSVLDLYNLGKGWAIRSEPVFTLGFYVIIVGYITICAGGIWDIVQKQKQIHNNPAVTLPTKKKINTELLTPQTTTQDEPTERLKKLKDMLDQGLISQEDYETKKAEILSKI